MMESAWDKELWHDKMQQLPLEGDENAMWQNMLGLLDNDMPAPPAGSGPAAPKNFPGAGTILSAIAILLAVAFLLYHYAGTPHTSRQKVESKITKVQADSLNGPAGHPNDAAADQRTAITKTVIGNSPDSLNSENTNGKGDKSVTANNEGAKESIAVKTAPGTAAPGTTNGGTHDKLSGGKSSGKKSGPGSAGTNVHGQLVNNSGGHYTKNPLFSNTQNSRNGYLQGGGSKGKAGRNSGKQGKNSAGQQGLVSNSAGGNATQSDQNGKQQSKKNIDSTFIKQKAGVDPISAAIKTSQQVAQNGLNLSNKPDSTNTPANNTGNKQASQSSANAKNKTAKDNQTKGKNGGTGNSKFELDLRAGLNKGSAYPGVSAGYFFTHKLGIMVGADIFASRTLSGSYNSKTQYTYRVDTGKNGLRQSGPIAISGSRKLYTIAVPVTANYHINKYISVYGGPVITFSAKANPTKANIKTLGNDNDTTRAYVAPYVSSTVIGNKLNTGFTGGIRLHFNRFFISGGYTQDFQNYTISSGLGSNKINPYHTFQLGIGFQIFKPKDK